MRRIARITGRKRAMHELPQLLDDTDAHARSWRRVYETKESPYPFLQRQAAADGNRLLTLAGKSMRRDFPFMLPANQRFFEEPRRRAYRGRDAIRCGHYGYFRQLIPTMPPITSK